MIGFERNKSSNDSEILGSPQLRSYHYGRIVFQLSLAIEKSRYDFLRDAFPARICTKHKSSMMVGN